MENQETISRWARQTFGETSALAIVARANVEMSELICAVHLASLGVWDDPAQQEQQRVHAATEVADVIIMLYQVADQLGADVHEFVNQKMAVNRGRVWERLESGRLQHVEHEPVMQFVDETPPDPAAALPETFQEPGSGLTMRTDCWYILSDSGSAYSALGFATVEAALCWAEVSVEAKRFELSEPPAVPVWQGSDWDDLEVANVLLGEHLYKFWSATEPELLAEINKGK